MSLVGEISYGSGLTTRVIRAPVKEWPSVTDSDGKLNLETVEKYGHTQTKCSEVVNAWRWKNIPNLNRGLYKAKMALKYDIPTFFGALYIKFISADGQEIDYGLASLRVVTTAGVGYIVDAFQNIVEVENMKFHGMGTTNTAEASADTALAAELTTQYNPDNTRATGSTTETSANIFRTVGTNTIDSGTPGVVEHGIFSQAATGGGVLLDRSVFSVINLVANDGIQFTYDLTFTAGG